MVEQAALERQDALTGEWGADVEIDDAGAERAASGAKRDRRGRCHGLALATRCLLNKTSAGGGLAAAAVCGAIAAASATSALESATADVANDVEAASFARAAILVGVWHVGAEEHRVARAQLLLGAFEEQAQRAGQHHQRLGRAFAVGVAAMHRFRLKAQVEHLDVGAAATG